MIEDGSAGLVRSKWLEKRIAERTLRRVVAAILERIRGANGNPIQRLHVLALIRRRLVVDLEVVVAQCLPQHVVHRRLLGGDHEIEESPAPLAESAVEAGAATNGRTDGHRADGEDPNQRILLRRQERLDFVQPEQARGVAHQPPSAKTPRSLRARGK